MHDSLLIKQCEALSSSVKSQKSVSRTKSLSPFVHGSFIVNHAAHDIPLLLRAADHSQPTIKASEVSVTVSNVTLHHWKSVTLPLILAIDQPILPINDPWPCRLLIVDSWLTMVTSNHQVRIKNP